MALAALIVGIVALLSAVSIYGSVVAWIPAIAGIVLGFKAKSNIKASRGMKSGGGMAAAGIVLSIIALVVVVLVLLIASQAII